MIDDQIRTAFTRFRAEETTRLPAPGVASAHQTAHRRRRLAATGAAGGLTAVLLLGAGYLAGLGAADPSPGVDAADLGPAPASTPAPEPVETDVLEPEERHQVAMAALGLDDDDRESDDTVLLIAGRGGQSAILQDPMDTAFEGGGVSGEIWLQVACGGTGSVEITIRAGAREATATAQCAAEVADAAAGRGEARLTVPEGSDTISILVEQESAEENVSWVGMLGASPIGGEQ